MGDGLRATGYGQNDGGSLSAPSSLGEGRNERNANGSLSSSLGSAERDLILEALRFDNGNRERAAKRLGISPRTLRYKLAKLREAGVEV
jgi:DNA-binding NtrC family response regulator